MSIRAVSEAITDLPYALSEQVLSYARSLDGTRSTLSALSCLLRSTVLGPDERF